MFVEHHRSLVRLGVLLGASQTAAEDAVAEVFARSWKAIDAGRVQEPMAYLRRSLVNELHRQGRRQLLERSVSPLVGVSAGFEDTTVARDSTLRALAALSTRQREVLVMRYLEDWSEADTARLLGISTGSVKRHTHRGLARLREAWGNGD